MVIILRERYYDYMMKEQNKDMKNILTFVTKKFISTLLLIVFVLGIVFYIMNYGTPKQDEKYEEVQNLYNLPSPRQVPFSRLYL